MQYRTISLNKANPAVVVEKQTLYTLRNKPFCQVNNTNLGPLVSLLIFWLVDKILTDPDNCQLQVLRKR